ncbi:MAG: cytochrome c family protein [Phycisphaerae bacterium]
MKTRFTILMMVIVCGTGLSIGMKASPESAESGTNCFAVAPAPEPSALNIAEAPKAEDKKEDSYSYVGSKACKRCHLDVHKSWAKTKMAQAFETLKPGNAKENKEKFKLDVNKDYSKDEKCIKCHTTGYGKKGGYAIPDPNDKKARRKAKKLQGVGCESCHGPGSEYSKVFKDILKTKRKYKVEELYAVGLRKIGKETCLTCHNEESPTINPGDTFDYEKRKDQGTHEHKPLKQREG